jgi:hypothetical protein
MRHVAAQQVRTGRWGMGHRLRVGALTVVMLAAVAGCDGAGARTDGTAAAEGTTAAVAPTPTQEDDSTGTSSPTGTATTAETATSMDTASWLTYTSDRYDLTIGYPTGWTVDPAVRDWTWAEDTQMLSPEGMEGFSPPEGDIFVTVFSVPFDPDKETTADVRAWVQDYCDALTAPCTDLDDRAEQLCVERRDCHPGLIVPFTHDVQAFFTGGHYNGRLVVASVWRNDSNITIQQRYGSFQNLLEGFLATMDVWPAPGTGAR